jgi:protein Mpv17
MSYELGKMRHAQRALTACLVVSTSQPNTTFPMSMLQRYQELLNTAPLRTKVLTSFCIFALGETNAQLLTNEVPKKGGNASLFDRLMLVRWQEVVGYACLSFYNAPLMHNFFLASADLSTPATVIAQMMFIDPLNSAVALALKALVKGKSLSEAYTFMCERFLPTFKTVLTVWPPVHIVNNLFVPIQFKVLVFNCMALCWQTYLCVTMQK